MSLFEAPHDLAEGQDKAQPIEIVYVSTTNRLPVRLSLRLSIYHNNPTYKRELANENRTLKYMI